MARRKLKLKPANRYNFGGFIRKAGESTLNFGKAVGDIGLSAAGLSNVIQDDDYRGNSAGFFKDSAKVVGGIAQTVAPVAMNAIVPGSGAFVSAGQQAMRQFNPEDEALRQQQELQQRQMQQAPTYKKGGYIPINVQGNGRYGKGGELEVANGRVTKDFKGQPSHENGGYTYTARSGRTIIPNTDRKAYLNGDRFSRTAMEQRLRVDQNRRDAEQKEAGYHIMPDGTMMVNADKMFEKGGKINFKSNAAYKAWLAYGHASGKFASTPGHQAVSIKGRSKNVDHMFGGGRTDGPETEPEYFNIDQNDTSYDSTGYSGLPFSILANAGTSSRALSAGKTPGLTKTTTDQFGRTIPLGGSRGNIGGSTGSTPGIPKPGYQIDWNSAAYNAAALAPSIYNLGYGIFGKKEQYDPQQYMNKSKVPYRDVDYSQIVKDIESQGNIARRNAYGASGGSAGNYLSNQAQIAGNTQGALARARIGADESNRAGRIEADRLNIGVEDANINRKLTIEEINAANRAKRSELIGKVLEGVSGFAQNEYRMKNLSDRDTYLSQYLKDYWDVDVDHKAKPRPILKRKPYRT